MTSPTFQKNIAYHRNQLLEQFGADDGKAVYVIQKAGQVIAFTLNRWQNPKAPEEILVGYGEGREAAAENFINAGRPVPVFIKEDKQTKDWFYAGTFELEHWTEDAGEKTRRVKRFDIPNIYKILFLNEVIA